MKRGRNTRFGTNRGRLPDAFHTGKRSVVRRRPGLPLLCIGKPDGAERPQVQRQEIPMPQPMTPGFQDKIFRNKIYEAYGKGISNDFTTHCASLSRMNQYSE